MDSSAFPIILYRPVGLSELEQIYDSEMKIFPVGLPHQPIFYPVLELEYARQIASEWNARSVQSAGYVTEFKVESSYIGKFDKHPVGTSAYQEFWIPAEELTEFNRHIVGHIKVLEGYFGTSFQGFIPDKFGLQGKNAIEQFTQLANSYVYKRMEFFLEIRRNHKAIFLNYPFWQKYEFKNLGLKATVLQTIKASWLTSFPKIALPSLVLAPEDEAHPANSQNVETNPASLVSDVDSDVMPGEELDLSSWEDPLEEAPTVRHTDPRSLVSVAPNADLPFEKTEESGFSPVDVVEGEIISAQETYSGSSENHTHEAIPPITQPSEDGMLNSVDKDVALTKQFDWASPADSVHETAEPIDPTNMHLVQGIKLGLDKKYHEAIDELSKAVKETPDDVVAHTSLGVAFHRVGEDERALSCYETTLRIDPTCAEAHYFRANVLYHQGNIREAIAGYTTALGLKPELITSHLKPLSQDRLTDFTAIPSEMNWIARPAQRILDLNTALETAASPNLLLKERAAAYYRLRNYVQCIADYSSYLRQQPEDASALHARALAYERLEQLERAQMDYQQALTINPQLSDEYINRGITFGNMGNFRQALASFTEGIRLAPQRPDGYFNRGITYFQEGTFERAIEDFSSVIRISPADEAAYYWRALSNEATGQQDKAVADYQRFLEISQDVNARVEIKQKLSQLESVTRSRGNNSGATGTSSQETSQLPPEESLTKRLDLYDLLTALGQRALNSIWLVSGITCYGERSEELYAFADQNKPIAGHDLVQIAVGIHQTITGDIQAFDPAATSPWIFIRAWNGSGFYIESNDPQITAKLRSHFPTMDDVEGASPPYESLFIET